jgi:CheY-like chemotaxis protein
MPKILLVEDDNNLREIYEARLQAEGYQIVSAKDGEEALVVAKAERPDLIISDVMMPKISGFEMLDILRNTPELRETKIIMLTALGQAQDQTRASNLGADLYLVKSQVTLEDIVKSSHDILNDMPQETPNSSSIATENLEPGLNPAEAESTAVTTAEAPEPVTPEPVTPEPVTPGPVTPETVTPEPVTPEPVTPTPPLAPGEISIDANGGLSSQTEAEQNIAMQQRVDDFLTATGSVMQPGSPSTEVTSNNQDKNDETLTQAVNNLVGNDTHANDSTIVEANPPAVANEIHEAPTISGHKIIQPLDQAPQKNLEELAAVEEASEIIGSPASPSTPDTTTPKNPFDPSDPNNIAI